MTPTASTTSTPDAGRLVFADDFDGEDLDTRVWTPHYLPAWSSRDRTRATYEIRDSPRGGYLEMRARAVVSPRSMVAWWIVGLEDVPERCAEICVFEVFGDAVDPGRWAAVGVGLHAFRDPGVTEDFEAVRLPLDVAQFHTDAVDWRPDRAEFLVEARSCAGAPGRPTTRCRWWPCSTSRSGPRATTRTPSRRSSSTTCGATRSAERR